MRRQTTLVWHEQEACNACLQVLHGNCFSILLLLGYIFFGLDYNTVVSDSWLETISLSIGKEIAKSSAACHVVSLLLLFI